MATLHALYPYVRDPVHRPSGLGAAVGDLRHPYSDPGSADPGPDARPVERPHRPDRKLVQPLVALCCRVLASATWTWPSIGWKPPMASWSNPGKLLTLPSNVTIAAMSIPATAPRKPSFLAFSVASAIMRMSMRPESCAIAVRSPWCHRPELHVGTTCCAGSGLHGPSSHVEPDHDP